MKSFSIKHILIFLGFVAILFSISCSKDNKKARDEFNKLPNEMQSQVDKFLMALMMAGNPILSNPGACQVDPNAKNNAITEMLILQAMMGRNGMTHPRWRETMIFILMQRFADKFGHVATSIPPSMHGPIRQCASQQVSSDPRTSSLASLIPLLSGRPF